MDWKKLLQKIEAEQANGRVYSVSDLSPALQDEIDRDGMLSILAKSQGLEAVIACLKA